MTPQLRQLQMLLRFWTGLFALGAFLFFIAPLRVIASLNYSTNYLHFLNPLDEISISFWLPLAVSLMCVLVLLCYLAAKNIEQAPAWVVPILLSKAVSSLTFFFFYVRQNFAAPFFWGALCDGMIFLITFYFFRRAFDGQAR